MTDHPNFVATQKSWDAIASGDFTMAMQFVPWFQGTWKQEGRCIYADDSMSVALVRETGTAPSGDVFDNMAVYVSRFTPDGKVDRLWTTDLAHEELEDFWRRNRIDA